jgi:hypothetical protein
MRPTDQLGAAVLAYANLGYRVLPLHHPVSTSVIQGRGMLCSCRDSACGAVGKHPLTPHGLNDATSDPAQLGRWWRCWPQANIGLVTGEVADVLDIDGPAGRAAVRRFAADHNLRLEGPLVGTGSGWHLYLAPTGSGTGPACWSRWTGVAAAGMWSLHPPAMPVAALPVAAATHRRTPPSAGAAAEPPRPHPSPAISAGSCGTVPPHPCWPSLRSHRARAGGGAGPTQASRPPPRRQVRPVGCDQGGPRSPGPRAARPAPSGRPSSGIVGAADRPALRGPGSHRRPTPVACAGRRGP